MPNANVSITHCETVLDPSNRHVNAFLFVKSFGHYEWPDCPGKPYGPHLDCGRDFPPLHSFRLSRVNFDHSEAEINPDSGVTSNHGVQAHEVRALMLGATTARQPTGRLSVDVE
jgi:hypothetical protein